MEKMQIEKYRFKQYININICEIDIINYVLIKEGVVETQRLSHRFRVPWFPWAHKRGVVQAPQP